MYHSLLLSDLSKNAIHMQVAFLKLASYSLTSMNKMYYSYNFTGDVIVLNFTKTNICL